MIIHFHSKFNYEGNKYSVLHYDLAVNIIFSHYILWNIGNYKDVLCYLQQINLVCSLLYNQSCTYKTFKNIATTAFLIHDDTMMCLNNLRAILNYVYDVTMLPSVITHNTYLSTLPLSDNEVQADLRYSNLHNKQKLTLFDLAAKTLFCCFHLSK